MFNSHFRKQLEESLESVLPPNAKIKSSTLLKAYATFSAIRDTHEEDFSAAYRKVRIDAKAYPKGILQMQTPIPATAPDAFRLFLSLDIESFCRFILSDLIGDPAGLLRRAKEGWGDDHLRLAHYVMQIKYTSYYLISGTHEDEDDSLEDALDKMYATYCTLDKDEAVRLSKSDFIDLYKLINLFPLDPNEYAIRHKGYDPSKLDRAVDILANQLELSREQQFTVLRKFFLENESAQRIIARFPPYRFSRMQTAEEREEAMRKALKLLSTLPPLNVLSAISVYKRHGGKWSLSSVVQNDIPLENGLIYSLFTARTLLDTAADEKILIFNPTPFFFQKWIRDPAARGKKVSFIFRNSDVSEVINYHFREGTYALPLDKNVSVLSTEQWKNSLRQSGNEACLSDSKILLFACGMSLSSQAAWYRLIKDRVGTRADLFILLSSYEFDHARSPFSSELDDPHINIVTVETIPQGINNSTSPRRKIFLRCLYNAAGSSSSETTKITAFTLNTDLKMQALSKMFDEPIEKNQQDLVGLYSSIRKLYQQELLARKATGRKNTAAISHQFTPDITVWCSKTYPKNNRGRPRLEAYVCLPGDPKRIENGFRDRGPIREESKKHTVKVGGHAR